MFDVSGWSTTLYTASELERQKLELTRMWYNRRNKEKKFKKWKEETIEELKEFDLYYDKEKNGTSKNPVKNPAWYIAKLEMNRFTVDGSVVPTVEEFSKRQEQLRKRKRGNKTSEIESRDSI